MEHNGTGPRHRRPRPDAATGATALQERPADGGEAPTSIDLEPSPANAKWRALLAEGGPILAELVGFPLEERTAPVPGVRGDQREDDDDEIEQIHAGTLGASW